MSGAIREPRLWLTSMCGPGNVENVTEMVEPILSHLDGIIWVLNDCAPEEPAARYLETVKGAGKVICRSFPVGRHWAAMNDTLFTGLIEEGDLVIWCDALERPMLPFVSAIKTEIAYLMQDADLDVIAYYGKPYLFRYNERLEYRNSPHWSLHGWNERGVEWSIKEPDESKVRLNVRPMKRKDPLHWVGHYATYWMYPAGSNHAALGIEQHVRSGETAQQAFSRREAQRLAFRQLMRARGFSLTMDGLKAMLTGPLDDTLKQHLNGEKTLSDVYWLWHGRGAELKDTHKPSDALPIP